MTLKDACSREVLTQRSKVNLPRLTVAKVETLQRTESLTEDNFGDWASRLARGVRDTSSSRLQIV